MLLVRVLIIDKKKYWHLVEIVKGESLYPEPKTPDNRKMVKVMMTEDQYKEAVKDGYECEIVLDYSKLPDPRDEVSKTNRYEEALAKLRSKKGGA